MKSDSQSRKRFDSAPGSGVPEVCAFVRRGSVPKNRPLALNFEEAVVRGWHSPPKNIYNPTTEVSPCPVC